MKQFKKDILTNEVLATAVSSGVILDVDIVLLTLKDQGYTFSRAVVTGALNGYTPEFFTRKSRGKYTITKEKIKGLTAGSVRGVTKAELFKHIDEGDKFTVGTAMKKLVNSKFDTSKKKVQALVYRLIDSGEVIELNSGGYMRSIPVAQRTVSAANDFTRLINSM